MHVTLKCALLRFVIFDFVQSHHNFTPSNKHLHCRPYILVMSESENENESSTSGSGDDDKDSAYSESNHSSSPTTDYPYQLSAPGEEDDGEKEEERKGEDNEDESKDVGKEGEEDEVPNDTIIPFLSDLAPESFLPDLVQELYKVLKSRRQTVHDFVSNAVEVFGRGIDETPLRDSYA